MGRRSLPPPMVDQEGPLPTLHIPRMPWFDRLYDATTVFEQFEHWWKVTAGLVERCRPSYIHWHRGWGRFPQKYLRKYFPANLCKIWAVNVCKKSVSLGLYIILLYIIRVVYNIYVLLLWKTKWLRLSSIFFLDEGITDIFWQYSVFNFLCTWNIFLSLTHFVNFLYTFSANNFFPPNVNWAPTLMLTSARCLQIGIMQPPMIVSSMRPSYFCHMWMLGWNCMQVTTWPNFLFYKSPTPSVTIARHSHSPFRLKSHEVSIEHITRVSKVWPMG